VRKLLQMLARGVLTTAVCALLLVPLADPAGAQGRSGGYKLGMFEENGRTFVGIVVDDAVVVDLSRADPDAPATVRSLIEHWDPAMAERIAGLASAARRSPAAYVIPLGQLRVLPPLSDPDGGAQLRRARGRNGERRAHVRYDERY
jgi:hypothetical protein